MQITIQQALNRLKETLLNHNSTSDQDAWWLLEYITNKKYSPLVMSKSELLTQTQMNTLEKIIQDIQADKPIAYIIGWVPFLNLQLRIQPPILIPRSETEYWCNQVITQLQSIPNSMNMPFRILDMCTGSGCIALSIAHAFPHAQVFAVDSNPDACALAAQNAQENNISNVTIIQSDLFTNLAEETFDLIVSNPPYIDLEELSSLDNSVKLWEDPRALIAADKGYALIKEIIIQAQKKLRHTGLLSQTDIPQLWLEIGHQQGLDTKLLMEQASFCKVAIMKDIYKRDRFVTGRLPYK